MTARISLLIPNYNRPSELDRLLRSVFTSIDFSDAAQLVDVMVVDDYSEIDISSAIAAFRERSNFTCQLQASKCGNAEVAFLSALDFVKTEYVWLLGNDDEVSPGGVGDVLRILASCNPGFILLNPSINRTTANRTFIPLSATSPSVFYEHAEDLFWDFGFVTSTTTFPCLIMKTEPVRRFHWNNRLTEQATVYSHSFTIFGALRGESALFLARSIIGFTLNELLDEREKLERQTPHGLMCYHQSLGLARLLQASSSITGIPIARFGSASEDEIDKNTMGVAPTTLSHFLASFFVEQMCREQINIQMPWDGFGYLSKSEIREIMDVITRFDDADLLTSCSDAIDVFNWPGGSPEWKITRLREAQREIQKAGRTRYLDRDGAASICFPKKIAASGVLKPLRGTSGKSSVGK
jgi:glycosyltransferase involved in cell wall biosynthesis